MLNSVDLNFKENIDYDNLLTYFSFILAINYPVR